MVRVRTLQYSLESYVFALFSVCVFFVRKFWQMIWVIRIIISITSYVVLTLYSPDYSYKAYSATHSVIVSPNFQFTLDKKF